MATSSVPLPCSSGLAALWVTSCMPLCYGTFSNTRIILEDGRKTSRKDNKVIGDKRS